MALTVSSNKLLSLLYRGHCSKKCCSSSMYQKGLLEAPGGGGGRLVGFLPGCVCSRFGKGPILKDMSNLETHP